MKDGLAIDIGGTFTDVVLVVEGRTYAEKVLTTPDAPTDAVIEGVERVLAASKVSMSSIPIVIHGTTLATNALIERQGARTALLTTEGHRDVLEMAFENRFEQYDVNIERPEPLVPRHFRLPIAERMNAAGEPLLPLDRDSVMHAIHILKENDVESVAVGFLHSYVNDAHERLVAEMLKENLPDVAVSLSSDVCPEIREYERLSTTCANAYVLPLMKSYLVDLEQRLRARGASCPLLMMTSGGGLTSFEAAANSPIRLIESGPAGGAILACEIARSLNSKHVVSFDMGGTTAKICLIDNGEALYSRSFEVDRRYRFRKGSGLPVRIPVIEMVEIGAGGGSIAKVDNLRRIQIGPESAGSEPGPACYGRDGDDATVTDADCVLGRLQPSRFAGGMLRLNVVAAKRAIDASVGSPLDMNLDESALGIAEIVDENMAAAARSHAAEWGKSLAGRTLVAFGGAAPLHAARMLEKLDLDAVIVPNGAGVGSALGFLGAPVSYEVVRSRYMVLSQYDEALVENVLAEMHREAADIVVPAAMGRETSSSATAYMRYVGQGYEISVGFDPSDVNQAQLQSRYDAMYKLLYGRLIPDAEIEVMSWTYTLSTREEEPESVPDSSGCERFDKEVETVALREAAAVVNARLIDRELLAPSHSVEGPALVAERHTTTVIPSDCEARVLASGALSISKVQQ